MRLLIIVFVFLFAQQVTAQYNYGIIQNFAQGPNSYNGWGDYMTVSDGDVFVARSRLDEVHVYTIQDDGTWVFKQSLTPSDKTVDHTSYWYYGSTMAIDGDKAIIAAQYKKLSSNEDGGLYFYHKGEDGMWYEEFKFENPSINTVSSYSYYGGKNITIHGNQATASHNNGYPRFVHIFERQTSGIWAITDTITDPEFLGIDGIKPYFDGNTFITMVFNWGNQRVKEYTLQSNGNWLNTDTLKSYALPDDDSYFGREIAVDGNQMVIGAYALDLETSDSILPNVGAAFVYEKINNKWILQQTILPDPIQSYANFGGGLALKNGLMVIQAPNVINIYKKIEGDWEKVQSVESPIQSTSFGRNIYIQGSQILLSGSRYGVFVLENLEDCAGVVGGSAMKNSCDICYGGTTGIDSLQSEASCIVGVTAIQVNEFSASPNPFSDELNVQIPAGATAYIIDIHGNKVVEGISTSKSVNTSALSAACYYLIIESAQKHDVVKLIKF